MRVFTLYLTTQPIKTLYHKGSIIFWKLSLRGVKNAKMEVLDWEMWEIMHSKALQADFWPLGHGVLLVVLMAVESIGQRKPENIPNRCRIVSSFISKKENMDTSSHFQIRGSTSPRLDCTVYLVRIWFEDLLTWSKYLAFVHWIPFLSLCSFRRHFKLPLNKIAHLHITASNFFVNCTQLPIVFFATCSQLFI